MKENVKVKGHLTATLIKKDGTVEVYEKDNIIVTDGFDFICDVIANSSQPAPMGYIGVGTDNTPPDVSDTSLNAQALRKAATYSHTPGTSSFSLTATFDPGEATAALTEAGVFNADTGGIMLDRVVFDVINKAASDTLTTTFTFTLS